MITFILLAILVVIVSLGMMTRPLFKSQKNDALARDAQNIHFAKTRLAELEGQLASAEITQEDYDQLKLEIETTLLQDIDLNNNTETDTPKPAKDANAVVITLLCTLIPFAALVLYLITGTPAALNPDNLVTQTNSPASINDAQDIDQMIASVEQRLIDNPEDVQAWTILARTYTVLERYQDAVNANLNLLKLTGESAAVYTQLADATALQAGGRIAGQPSEYIKKALAIDPQYPQALWLAGLDAAQVGNIEQARSYWNTLLPLLANAPQQQQELRDIIAQTIGEAEAAPQTQSAVTAPPKADAAENTTSGLTIKVTLAESVQASAGDTVFVFARAQNGPPAPLAVKRLTVADLPAQVQLSDSDAMLEQFKLSLFDDVVVTARVSKSGNPIAQAGDIQSAAVNSKNKNSEIIELTISELVE